MPVGFVAHGAPFLALDPVKGGDLRRWALQLQRPSAILIISAHWEQAPLAIGATATMPLIYDFYGFPAALYELKYPAPGTPEIAQRVKGLLMRHGPPAHFPERGLDHGAWVPLVCMYPQADIPVLQISLPAQEPKKLFQLGQDLAPLRNEGVLILGSGNLTHNLAAIDWNPEPSIPDWAAEFDAWVEDTLQRNDVDALLNYQELAPGVKIALPTHEHFVPLILATGAAQQSRPVSVKFPVTGFEFGSISRRCVEFFG